MASEQQIAAFQHYCEEVGGALAGLVGKAERLGFAAPLTITAIVGSLAAISVAADLKRENIIAALNAAFDDILPG